MSNTMSEDGSDHISEDESTNTSSDESMDRSDASDDIHILYGMEQMENILKKLRSSRYLPVQPSDEDEPYLVPESLIQSQNILFLKRALYEQRRNPDPLDPLLLPDDDPNAVRLYLYWLMVDCLPSTDREINKNEIEHLFYAWIMGSKYRLSRFQDHVMLELLKYFRNNTIDIDVMKLAFEKTKGENDLRKLMAEEVAYAYGTGDMVFEDMGALDGTPGLLAELMEGQKEYNEYKGSDFCLDRLLLRWTDFTFCAHSIGQHWIHGLRTDTVFFEDRCLGCFKQRCLRVIT